MKASKTEKLLLIALLCSSVVWADTVNGVNINFVNIGNEGNAGDTDLDPQRNGYGAVGYSYRIAETELSYAQFTASGIGGGSTWTNTAAGTLAPVVDISWHDAARYANWLTSSNANNGAYSIAGGKVQAIDRDGAVATYGTVYVLPTEDEWYKAAYYTGSGYSLFANGTGIAPIAEVDAAYGRAMVTGPWSVAAGSSEQNSTLNMSGNVWEWLENPLGGEAYNPADDAQLMAFRGGGYSLGSSFLEAGTRASDDRAATYNVGVRIVAIPEPGTLSMLSLSTLSLFLTRTLRRRKLAGRSLLPVRHENLCDTYCTQEEHEASFASVVEQNEWVTLLVEKASNKLSIISGWFLIGYQKSNQVFWDYMVSVHTRKVIRRQAFRKSLKKKTLAGFDSFLALILK